MKEEIEKSIEYLAVKVRGDQSPKSMMSISQAAVNLANVLEKLDYRDRPPITQQ